jgi:hypothetical protein
MEGQSASASSTATHQTVKVADLDPWTSVYDEAREAMMWICLRVGHRIDKKIVCSDSSHYESFLSIQDEVISFVFGTSGSSKEV